jgi:hypothetical protein
MPWVHGEIFDADLLNSHPSVVKMGQQYRPIYDTIMKDHSLLMAFSYKDEE